MKTGYECTAHFKGIDGQGTCDTGCQWWKDGCPCAKGSEKWDGLVDNSLCGSKEKQLAKGK